MTNIMKFWSSNFRLDNFIMNIQLCHCRGYEEYKVHEKEKKLIDDFFPQKRKQHERWDSILC